MIQLRVRLIQANPTVGDLDGNLALALHHLEAARGQVDLLVFPECFLSGYSLQDLVLRPSFQSAVRQRLQTLAQAVQAQDGPAVLMGAPLSGTHLPLNAAVLLRPDGTRQSLVKSELPNTDVFDERRTFERGGEPAPLTLGDWQIGAMICEDLWHGRVGRRLADEGADFFLVINGSPMELGKQAIRLRHGRHNAQTNRLPLMYLNLTGGQDELVFDGSSFVLDAGGERLAQAPWGDAVLDVLLEKQPGEAARVRGVARADAAEMPAVEPARDDLEHLYWTLTQGLRDYVGKNGIEQVFLGLSGGLDSALVAALAVDALGPQGLTALMLPAVYTGDESKSLATDMADRLGCRYTTLGVDGGVQAMAQLLDHALGQLGIAPTAGARQIAGENIQARVRGQLLMALSNATARAIVLSTGNKSEMSVGYATLYGDMCGGFNPIKDLYKTRVQALSHWRNAHHLPWMRGPVSPIPERIISRPPTAELAEGQTDEGSLGAYPMLDAVLEGLIEHQLSPEAAAREAAKVLGYPVEEAYARRIAGLVQRAEYKRRQAPPGIKVTGRSFGFGWRYPITNAHRA